MEKRFTCNTTMGNFLQVMRRENELIHYNKENSANDYPEYWDGDDGRLYRISAIPRATDTTSGGVKLEYYAESWSDKTHDPMTRRSEGGIIFYIQPIGDDRVNIFAECNEEIFTANFEYLLSVIGKLYSESGLNVPQTQQKTAVQPDRGQQIETPAVVNAIQNSDNELTRVVSEADAAHRQSSKDWWRLILTFQNKWNEEKPRDPIANAMIANKTNVQERTVINKRFELGLSQKRETRTDLIQSKRKGT